MIAESDERRIKSHLKVWWTIWAGILGMVCVIYFAGTYNKPRPPASSTEVLIILVGFIPLFMSVVIRWLILPRSSEPTRAFVMFVVGLALAEMCGVFGIFLGGGYRDVLFLLGIFGIVQFAPFYARRFFKPRVSGFIPNN